MGYVFAHGNCCACGTPFAFNPNLVPSIKMRNGKIHPEGQREPVCQQCMDVLNDMLKKRGEPVRTVHPAAYEPADENSIDWNDNRTMMKD